MWRSRLSSMTTERQQQHKQHYCVQGNIFLWISWYCVLFAYSTENEAEPVYEVPSEKYTVEEIIRILLNPKIDQSKVCKQRSLDIVSSSTYVVDLDCLQHLDDIKKDNFGVWTHSGSHTQQFCSRINHDKVEIGRSAFASNGPKWKTFSLRRLHSKHPTNPSFRRIISFVSSMCMYQIIFKWTSTGCMWTNVCVHCM